MVFSMFHWIALILYAGFIFYLSSQPDLAIIENPFLMALDPEMFILHFLEYGPFGLLAARAVSKTPRLSAFSSFLLPVVMGFLYGVTDEVHQFFVPGRTASPFDLMADTLGILIGVYLWRSASGKGL